MPPLDSGKQERIEDFLRKSLLGEELINTQFHLFSARSVPLRRLTRPRVLCANNVLLAESSTYFVDLLSSDITPSDPALSDITGANDIPTDVQMDDFGYGSDSDLDDDDDEPPILRADMKNRSTSPHQISTASKDDNELSEDDTESVSSDMFVMSPEHPSLEEPLLLNLDRAGSVASNETAVQVVRENKTTSQAFGGVGSRHVLVRDTAFRTWYALLNHLYTGKINFLPLTSAASGDQSRKCSTSSPNEPRCSAKSMYRLACKVGLDHLRDEALTHIRTNLTEQNILKELSCSLATRHPQLLEMELDVLYTHIASLPVVTGFPALAQRIANKEVPHGADIIVGIHQRFLKAPPSTSRTRDPSPTSSPIHVAPSFPRSVPRSPTPPVPSFPHPVPSPTPPVPSFPHSVPSPTPPAPYFPHPVPRSPTPPVPSFPHPVPSPTPLAPSFPHSVPSPTPPAPYFPHTDPSPTPPAPSFPPTSFHGHPWPSFSFGGSQTANEPIPNELFASETKPSDVPQQCNAAFDMSKEPSKTDSDMSKGKLSSSALAKKKKKR